MKKKIIIFTLVLSTLLLYGCSTNTNQRPSTPSTPETVAPSADKAPSTNPQPNNSVQNNTTNTTTITEEEAKEIALNHAGLTADQVTFTKVKPDRDDYTEHYDIEFYTNDQKEYDYEIDLYTGDILEWDVEPNRL